MDHNAAGRANLGAQTAANACCFLYQGVASFVNGDCIFGTGLHTNAAGNAYLAVGGSESFHSIQNTPFAFVMLIQLYCEEMKKSNVIWSLW